MQIKTTLQNLSSYKKNLAVRKTIHEYLQEKGYLELELPVLSPVLIPESYLENFHTEFRYMDTTVPMYLTPSPELFIKRLLSEGIGNCYYMGKSFRNSEPNSPKHQPEFTMLEFYQVDASYKDIAIEVLGMLQALAQKLYGSTTFEYQGIPINVGKWEEYTIAEVFEKWSGIQEETLFDHQSFLKQAETKGYTTKGFSYEDVFSQMYTQEIEPHLGMNGYPTILYDYPKEFAALSKPNTDGRTAQRFEFYIAGLELGNCYSELTDWQEQETRFHNEVKLRRESGKMDILPDWGFIENLKKGLPDCSGIAIGVDRLAMVFTNSAAIEDTQLLVIE